MQRLPIACWTTLLLGVSLPALAYLDPGTGSYVLQVLAGGALAALLLWRGLWSRLLGLFRRKPPDPPEDRPT